MHFRYTPVPDWPPLAWLACGHRGDPTVEVFHGLDVETTPDGFSEAVWDGRRLRERPKPAPPRDFGDFAAYRGFLEASLAGLAQNLSSSGRAVPLRMLGTISSGYDSPAVTVLAQPYGLQEAIAFEPSS